MAEHVPLVVFGKRGQVARELAARAPDALFLDRSAADLSDPEACAAVIRDHAPAGVINAAAYTAVDRAEAEPALAQAVNGDAPGAMARACAQIGVPFVHISTDYVFDGTGVAAARGPGDATAPCGVYGRTKLAGERAVTAAGGAHVILRTSWVFSAHGSNFLQTMLQLGSDHSRLTVVADQVGGPTPAGDIAATCLQVLDIVRKNPEKSGIYHYSGAPDVSWADFARAIFACAGMAVTVEAAETATYEAEWRAKNPDKPRATRPLNSRLDCSTLEAEFDISRPDWQAAVKEIVRQLT